MREAEVVTAANRTLLTRVNYTSEITRNGVEEPKSTETTGLGLRVLFEPEPGGRPLVGFGSEPSVFGGAGIRRAPCINDNITRRLQSVVRVTADVKGTMMLGADGIVYAPGL